MTEKERAATEFQELMLGNGAEIWPKDPRWINDYEPTGVFANSAADLAERNDPDDLS